MRTTVKRLAALLTVGATLLAAYPVCAIVPTQGMPGDLNGDMLVDSADQRLLLQANGGAADLDQNNVVDDRDAELLWLLSLGALSEDELDAIIQQTPDETTTLPSSTTTSSEATSSSGSSSTSGSTSPSSGEPTSSSTTATTEKPTTSTTTTTTTTTTKKTTTTTKKPTTTTTTTTKPTTSTTKPSGGSTAPVAQVRPTLEKVTTPKYTPTLKTGGKANSQFDLTVKNTTSGKIYTNETKEDLQMLLSFIVKAECGQASFAPNSTEGWKAQAVAAYTHLCYSYNGKTYNFSVPKGKDIDLTHPNDKRIYEAVGEVVGVNMLINGKTPICAYYSGSCPGTTRNNFTGWDLAYIQPVYSAETVELCEKYGYTLNSTVTTTLDELKETLGDVFGETIYADSKSGYYPLYATSWSGAHVDKTNLYYKSGSTKVYLTGHQVRTYMGWKSASFVVTGMSGDTMTVSVSAHGHGAGFSQVGAAIFANEYGWTYAEILAHYYSITAKSTHQLYEANW